MSKIKLPLLSIGLSIMLLLGFLPWSYPQVTLANGNGLINSGFELDLSGWTPINDPAPDDVKVVGTEGPADFPTYDSDNMDVDAINPFGNKMLRLGSPKEINESQERDIFGVQQSFTADSSGVLKFVLRLFSWEHRGYDVFRINLTEGNEWDDVKANDVEISIPTDYRLIDTDNSDFLWEVAVDVGKRGDYLATEWMTAEITGLIENQTYILSYSVEGTDNNAHASWAYFDVNTPPVAKFTFSPLNPHEGEIVEFLDLSYDPDHPNDAIVSWQWNIDWEYNGDHYITSSSAQFPYFIPPDNNGSYNVSLTVTDILGESDTVDSGMLPSDGGLYEPGDGFTVPPLVVSNMAPKVNALNMEVLAGDDATMIGRSLDTGWLDEHTEGWKRDGIDLDPNASHFEEDNLPFVSTGIATYELPDVQSSFTGTLTITETPPDSEAGFDNFTVSVIEHDIERHEDNNTPDTAFPLAPDWIYLSYIQENDDIDWFKVDLPPGNVLSTGDEILVSLKGLPADYDLVLLSEFPPGMQPAGYNWFGYNWFGYNWFGYNWFGYNWFGYNWFGYNWFGYNWFSMSRPPFQGGPFQVSNYLHSGYNWFGYNWFPFSGLGYNWFALSQAGYTGLKGDDIGGTDISLEEIGLGSFEEEGLQVASYSANRGDEEEVLLFRCEVPGTKVYIGVLGHNGAHSAEPYQLQIEMSEALDLSTLLDELAENGIAYEPPSDDYSGTTTKNLYPDGPSSPTTLFVTQEERLRGLYGDNEWELLLTDLKSLADEPDILGRIISVPNNSTYEYWDTNTDEVSAANEVTVEIRNIIQQELENYPTIEYVVLVGNDEIIPHRRVPDETAIGNERSYAMSSFIKLFSPLFFSFWEGCVLSDDYFVDAEATPWQGRLLYIPDLPIARLVETPQEIRGVANTFINSGGILDPLTALVTGYDFFIDGTEAIANTTNAASLNTNTLINDTWSATDLLNLLEQGLDINSVNAHFSHYAALSALGFWTEDWADSLISSDITAMGDVLEKKIVFSMGCHAGLNVPDQASLEAIDIGFDINPSLDMVQAFTRKGAIYLASIGYGYGDDEGIGATERLAGIFVEELLLSDNATTVGQALVSAKQNYLNSLSAMTVYDEKSSIQFTLYGLPQYRIEPGIEVTSLTMQNQGTSTPVGNLQLVVTGAVPDAYTIPLERWDTDSGSYYTADGDAQATAGRTKQPRVVLDISSASIAHDILLTGGSYTDYTDFDPVITRPTNEWEQEPEEIQILFPSFWPSELATINNLETDGEIIQTLVITPGQFRGEDLNIDGHVIGTQRLFTNLTFELLHSDPSDYEPPVISSIDLKKVDENTVEVIVETSDETTGNSGIARIVVLTIGDGTVTSTSESFSETPADNLYTVTVPNVSADDNLIVQVVDGADNVAYASAKGANMYAIQVDAGPDRDLILGEPTNFAATLFDFYNLSQPVFFMWDFGDGNSYSGWLTSEDVTPDGNGNATFSVEHIYAEDMPLIVTATLRVTDTSGGIGIDNVLLARWTDPLDANGLIDADLINGYAITDGEWVTIGIRVYGEISNDFQYRLNMDLEPGGNYQLRYNKGEVTGLSGLECSIEEYNGLTSELQFRFRLADAGLNIGDRLWLSAETQAGVQKGKSKGMIDNMPDSGSILWIIE